MNICLDLSPAVHRKAGLGTYASSLAEHLLHVDVEDGFSTFHYGRAVESPLPPALAALPQHHVSQGARLWRLSVALRYWLPAPMDGLLPGVDLFHATEHLLPPFRGIRSVFTFHDAIYALFPEYHLPMNRVFLGLMMPRFLSRADAIIAVSECSKRDAVRLYGVDPARIRVIYEGVAPEFRVLEGATRASELERVRRKYGLPPRYLLYFSTIEPRKNVPTLLEAYRSLINQVPAPDLVLAGRKGWLYEPTLQRVRELGLAERVHFPGWIDQADAPALLNGAEVMVFPSLYEGFGLPPLEAMACGVPVVCSDAASLPEVIGNAGLLFPPRDIRALTTALTRVLSDADLRAELAGRGFAQARRFTWEQAARETIRVYKEEIAHRH